MTLGLSDDEIAQAACAAVGSAPGFISAVRRPCPSTRYGSCDMICKNAACSMKKIYGNYQGAPAGTCIETYHLYKNRNTLRDGETGKAVIAMARFGTGTCKYTGCGPNYCCCKVTF
uniref:Uncharacterized protein LOC111129235 n=1 Tax=Crassostrea virginica TaxID=6565 RepID=A0A8B8DU84_CRAVI|nr:uncharacterized protein LOC111129235 [Crassostrea virginica]